MVETVDRLFVHAGEIVTLADGPARGARRGEGMQALGVVPDGAIAVRDGRIVAVGATDEVGKLYRAPVEHDLGGTVVLPGFVDCHTHPVFAATREDEFHMRCAGADYMAIAEAGGGILSSVRAVRAAGEDQLFARTMRIFDGFLAAGTTTVEGKSGYGIYADGMMELDDHVGELLDLLDETGVADNTLVMWATDNGPACNSWPDGGNHPFAHEKAVGGFEGGFRVPVVIRWPGVVPAGVATGEFMT
ncbi:MAG: sulfatase-like hydrolase/transferase, partial [Planctomycetota bacterium]